VLRRLEDRVEPNCAIKDAVEMITPTKSEGGSILKVDNFH
jgi:hypothetical protein